MGQKDKLIKKLKSKQHDFTFDEAETLLNYLSFNSFDHGSILLHKPHPRNELREYQVKLLREKLEQEGLI